MTHQWIHPPRKITKEEYWDIQQCLSVELESSDIPDNDAFRYADIMGNFYCDDEDGTGRAEVIGGYFFIAEDMEQLREGYPANACVQVEGSTYFIVGQHAPDSPRSNLGHVAGRGELYLISFEDYKAIDWGSTFSSYLLDALKTDRSAEDPYRLCAERGIGEPVEIPNEKEE